LVGGYQFGTRPTVLVMLLFPVVSFLGVVYFTW